jgi:hypothetical protein
MSMSAGLDFSVVVVRAGTVEDAAATEVYSWGNAQFGQTGHGDDTLRRVPAKIKLLERCYVSRVDCGDRHTIAATPDDKLYGWGCNVHGQLGTFYVVLQADMICLFNPVVYFCCACRSPTMCRSVGTNGSHRSCHFRIASRTCKSHTGIHWSSPLGYHCGHTVVSLTRRVQPRNKRSS